ncbi:hypothetical protein [Micromonospora rosaria]|uniref:hypothetical protein n=1 Tax=Micromonospora rosaria TaxID=47874 RepID=UPI0012F74C61|nr:hypothetical protein [Micromonospora rosaria]
MSNSIARSHPARLFPRAEGDRTVRPRVDGGGPVTGATPQRGDWSGTAVVVVPDR